MSPFPLDPSAYQWSQQSPFLWRRRALASEPMWISRPKELHDMFISGIISLEIPLPKATLKSAARNAWRSLRFEIPELVAKGKFQDGKPIMQYQTPKDKDAVNEWINRTAFFDQGSNGLTFEGQREKLLLMKRPFDLDTASLLLYSELDTDEDLVNRFHLMLNMDHEATDGIGTRILFGKYLSLLAKFLSGSPGGQDEIEWAESSRNLSPPWISIMDEEQVTCGPEYEEMAQMNKTMLLESMAQNPGLPLLTQPSPPCQQTHFITLSTTQTSTLITSIKTISPAANITSLAHAALVLALLRSSPPPLPPTFYSSCWLNGRRYLRPPTPTTHPEKEYIPCCMSFAPIIFPDLSSLLLAKDASKNETKHKLKKACLVATSEYTKIRERKSILPEIVVLLETIGAAMSKYSPPLFPAV
ncbi:Trichothecene 15-O-acetyltransferase [Lachnellula occidentalis]|uniref:Trichothecene 15-O-acetyltransferase n=1 Tax=Lachnellula occidentalis TaxID=215460 RepID=A0A8H8UCG6_9HELO|nr:Trichothecene 15-O-acetyltransferase [Lachnellula occidentalis]